MKFQINSLLIQAGYGNSSKNGVQSLQNISKKNLSRRKNTEKQLQDAIEKEEGLSEV